MAPEWTCADPALQMELGRKQAGPRLLGVNIRDLEMGTPDVMRRSTTSQPTGDVAPMTTLRISSTDAQEMKADEPQLACQRLGCGHARVDDVGKARFEVHPSGDCMMEHNNSDIEDVIDLQWTTAWIWIHRRRSNAVGNGRQCKSTDW